MMKEIKFNPRLSFIREDIPGNLCIDGEFVFDQKKDKLPFENLFKWMTSPNPQRNDKKLDSFTPEVIPNLHFTRKSQDQIVWLGHSSFFIQLNGINILTDPVFHDLTPFLRRKHALPCDFHHFENIDYILLSHGHRDHLDIPTLKKIIRFNPDCEILCPLGFEKLLKQTGCRKIQEAAWWQRYDLSDIDITFLPAKHWNRRFILDYNTALWGSFALSHEHKHIYFAGDTGYSGHFREISRYFPGFDVCLMPVGAYKPKFVMEWAHTSPEEAVLGFHELNGKTFIPMHYGTFDLSDEPASEPIQMLRHLHQQEQLNGTLSILKIGEEFKL